MPWRTLSSAALIFDAAAIIGRRPLQGACLLLQPSIAKFAAMVRLIALWILALSGYTASGQSDSIHQVLSDTTGPQFYFSNNDRAHNFGAISINGNAEYKFEFTNTGTRPLLIKEMRSIPKGINTPPYKVLVNYPQGPIRPGKAGIITALVVAQANTGSFKCEVQVTSNATRPNYPLLLLTGAIVPEHSNISPSPKPPVIPIEYLVPLINAASK